jgi:hypothetical protein
MCTSFKAEVLLAVHDFRATGGDTFKLALYSSTASLNANTTAYTATGEITGTNYTAGGKALTNGGVTASNTNESSGTGFATFSNLTWSNATFTARGALIYNTTPSANGVSNVAVPNAAVAVLDFGVDKTVTNASFTVVFPSATNTTAIVRIA